MSNTHPLEGLTPPRPRVERDATESTRLDAEFAAKVAAQGAPAPAPSDPGLRHGDQIRRHQAEQDAKRQAQLIGPGIDIGYAARVEDLQARAAEADARQAEWERKQLNEALGRS